MMYEFRFPGAEIRRIAEATKNASEWTQGWGAPEDEKPHPQLVFVKDHGVYMCPNHKLGEGETPSNQNLVVYAEGYDPEKHDFDEWWVGGDDFAEYLPIAWCPPEGQDLVLKMTDNQIIAAFPKARN